MRGVVNWNEVATGTSVKTMAQLVAGTNHQLKLTELSLTFQGVDNLGVPVLVEILRQTTAGTSSAATIAKMDDSDGDTIDATALDTFSAEPTAGDVLRSFYVHPQTGFHYVVPDPDKFKVGGGDRIGVRVTATATVDCAGFMEFEE